MNTAYHERFPSTSRSCELTQGREDERVIDGPFTYLRSAGRVFARHQDGRLWTRGAGFLTWRRVYHPWPALAAALDGEVLMDARSTAAYALPRPLTRRTRRLLAAHVTDVRRGHPSVAGVTGDTGLQHGPWPE